MARSTSVRPSPNHHQQEPPLSSTNSFSPAIVDDVTSGFQSSGLVDETEIDVTGDAVEHDEDSDFRLCSAEGDDVIKTRTKAERNYELSCPCDDSSSDSPTDCNQQIEGLRVESPDGQRPVRMAECELEPEVGNQASPINTIAALPPASSSSRSFTIDSLLMTSSFSKGS